MTELTPFAQQLAEIAFAAGKIVLRHYADTTLEARHKPDHSPVTAADEETEAFILAKLKALAPDVPAIAEEQVAAGGVTKIGRRFFLVDPLDGTKEFLNRNGEFTVNIAEIVDGVPLRGVVYIPAKARMFVGEAGTGAFEVPAGNEALDWAAARKVEVCKPAQDGLVVVASRSHRDYKTEDYLAGHKVKDFKAAGSSLKFCLVAAGEADLYPRLGRSMEWDTAAGHAVLAAAGGSVTTLDGQPFVYGKVDEKFANPHFLARGAK
jgi:3'(2'),5'-bisphosphate nucleotidase